MAHEKNRIIVKKINAFMILESKTIPPEYFNELLLKSLLVLLTKKPRNNPKNKKTTIYLGLIMKSKAREFSSGIRNINKNNPHLTLYKDKMKIANIKE